MSQVHWYYAPGYAALALMVLAEVLRLRQQAAISAVLFVVWLVATCIAMGTGAQDLWAWNAIIDLAAAFLISTMQPLGLAVLVASVSGLMVIAHMSYGAIKAFGWDDGSQSYSYWWALFYLACLQCGIIGGSVGIDVGKRMARHRSRDRVRISGVEALRHDPGSPDDLVAILQKLGEIER